MTLFVEARKPQACGLSNAAVRGRVRCCGVILPGQGGRPAAEITAISLDRTDQAGDAVPQLSFDTAGRIAALRADNFPLGNKARHIAHRSVLNIEGNPLFPGDADGVKVSHHLPSDRHLTCRAII